MTTKSRIRASYHQPGAAFFHQRAVWLGLMGVAALLLALPLAVHGLTSLSQSYATDEKLAVGSIVSVKDNSANQVVAASTRTLDSLLGVVINDSSALLTLSSKQNQQVHVATSGIAPVLVSDINGKITQGDHITASPIKGVGMKATNNSKVVGIAQGELRQSNKSQQTYTDAQGNEQTVMLGEAPVMVNVAYYFSEPDKTLIPSAIQDLANALAGKPVKPIPIIISAAIFIITLGVVVSIIYSMIRSSIISVGRNPMSQSAVYRDVIQLSALVLGILAVAVIAIYLILTRF